MAVGINPDGSAAPLVDLGWEGPSGNMYSNEKDLVVLLTEYLKSDARYNQEVRPRWL
jgi:hypothetical protein